VGVVYLRPVGTHLKLLQCLSEQELLLSLSGVFLLLGKRKVWALGSAVNQYVECLGVSRSK
jgi:hypothetical protein